MNRPCVVVTPERKNVSMNLKKMVDTTISLTRLSCFTDSFAFHCVFVNVCTY